MMASEEIWIDLTSMLLMMVLCEGVLSGGMPLILRPHRPLFDPPLAVRPGNRIDEAHRCVDEVEFAVSLAFGDGWADTEGGKCGDGGRGSCSACGHGIGLVSGITFQPVCTGISIAMPSLLQESMTTQTERRKAI